jgi:hypothetical protein
VFGGSGREGDSDRGLALFGWNVSRVDADLCLDMSAWVRASTFVHGIRRPWVLETESPCFVQTLGPMRVQIDTDRSRGPERCVRSRRVLGDDSIPLEMGGRGCFQDLTLGWGSAPGYP